MNRLSGRISSIESSGELSLVEIEVEAAAITAMVLDTQDSSPLLRPGQVVSVLFKETEVSLAKGETGNISLRNRIPAVIRKIEEGSLLAHIVLDSHGRSIHSLITLKSCRAMDLRVGDSVTALIKSTEISLGEVP